MLHSGSRNIGNVIAKHHIEKAKKICEQRQLPHTDLAWLSIEDGDAYTSYVHDLAWAQDYATLNRAAMFEITWNKLLEQFPKMKLVNKVISCHHNYVEFDYNNQKDLFLTRKGAVAAYEGSIGVILGSMGTKSYIVEGRGSEASYNSCSHGAGRKYSRSSAKKHFDVKDLIAQTQGIECRKDISVLDEIPGAYKDVEVVMANQSDLVDIKYELKQVLCIKG